MSDQADGGYYAIKGFLYQFDKTLIEILTNPNIVVEIEVKQDIAYQEYVIQVKHKETQEFSHHKVKKPIIQLLDEFSKDHKQRFCLYCHFKDRSPTKWELTLTELNQILGGEANKYATVLRQEFLKNFYLQFSEDYESQFETLINLIHSSFDLTDQAKAYLYHSLFRSKLLDISIKHPSQRTVSRLELDAFISAAEKTIFYTSYSKHLSKDKYERLIRREYFTHGAPNLEKHERLFIVHCEEQPNIADLSTIVNRLVSRYFRVNKSPQPYLCLTALSRQDLIDLKRDLVTQGIAFSDGTLFNGDSFRIDVILARRLSDDNLKIKIVGEEFLSEVVNSFKFHEVYQFYLDKPLDIRTRRTHIKIQISEMAQVKKMIG